MDLTTFTDYLGFPGGASGKESACQCRRCKTWVRPLGQEDPLKKKNGNPLQYSCLENSMDREAWWATVHGVGKSWTQMSARARAHTHTH